MHKCEILDGSDFHDFYTIKPFWVGDYRSGGTSALICVNSTPLNTIVPIQKSVLSVVHIVFYTEKIVLRNLVGTPLRANK